MKRVGRLNATVFGFEFYDEQYHKYLCWPRCDIDCLQAPLNVLKLWMAGKRSCDLSIEVIDLHEGEQRHFYPQSKCVITSLYKYRTFTMLL